MSICIFLYFLVFYAFYGVVLMFLQTRIESGQGLVSQAIYGWLYQYTGGGGGLPHSGNSYLLIVMFYFLCSYFNTNSSSISWVPDEIFNYLSKSFAVDSITAHSQIILPMVLNNQKKLSGWGGTTMDGVNVLHGTRKEENLYQLNPVFLIWDITSF